MSISFNTYCLLLVALEKNRMSIKYVPQSKITITLNIAVVHLMKTYPLSYLVFFFGVEPLRNSKAFT